MAFFSINCSFDVDSFRLCMRYLVRSNVVCAMITSFPTRYLDYKIVIKARRFFRFLTIGTFIFLIRKPYEYEIYQHGSGSFIMGYVLFDGVRYGLLASNYLAMVNPTTDILDLFLPIILSGFFCLLNGGTDIDGHCVERCDSVVILGALISRGYPVPPSYVWPEYKSLFPSLPLSCYGSQTRNHSCLYQPFIYNWHHQSLYVDADKFSGSNVKKEINSVLSMCRKNLSEGSYFEKILPETHDIKLDGVAAYNFISSVYQSQEYEFWHQVGRSSWENAVPEDFYFTSNWVQILTFEHRAEALMDNCGHFSCGPRLVFSSDVSKAVRRLSRGNEIDISSYKPKANFRIPFSRNTVNRVTGSETLKEIQLECYLFFLLNRDPVDTDLGSYTVIDFPLSYALSKAVQFCHCHVGSARSHFKPGFCIFGCPYQYCV